jgi:hypothetical protein
LRVDTLDIGAFLLDAGIVDEDLLLATGLLHPGHPEGRRAIKRGSDSVAKFVQRLRYSRGCKINTIWIKLWN